MSEKQKKIKMCDIALKFNTILGLIMLIIAIVLYFTVSLTSFFILLALSICCFVNAYYLLGFIRGIHYGTINK